MKISNIKLNNFKFHKNLEIQMKNTNCIIYGENGTGKSSIYEAIYSVFKTYFRNNSFDFNKYKNNIYDDSLSAEISFGDVDKLMIPNADYTLPSSISISNKQTIYFANQDLLELITGHENNFYVTINNYLKKYFESLNCFCQEFERINFNINDSNYVEENDKREYNIKGMKKFFNQLELRANDIIKNYFQEEFVVNFEYDWGISNTEDDYKYPNPQLTLKINDKDNLKLNFNEAKLKLTSISIFFGLMKIEEGADNNNPLKLLVLDDFLTSLDMANRQYIIEYILENFKAYQKIVLTHNLQFYNLTLNLLKSRNEQNDWDNKNIFIRKVNNIDKSLVYDKNDDYIKEANDNINDNKLDEAGIYLRKEFERLIEQLRQINEVGAKEKLSNIVNQLLQLEDTGDVNIEKMQTLLKRTKFYQDTTLHSTAHDNITNERYTKELQGAIVILEQLKKYITQINQ